MTEYKCGSAKSCKYGDMCKPNFNIGACSHYKAEEPQTNEEWFDSLTTEEKADFFCTVQNCLTIYGDHIAKHEDWVKWLKQPHREGTR